MCAKLDTVFKISRQVKLILSLQCHVARHTCIFPRVATSPLRKKPRSVNNEDGSNVRMVRVTVKLILDSQNSRRVDKIPSMIVR